MSKIFKEFEEKIGFSAAKQKNPNLKMLIGMGSFASSELASKNFRGRRPSGLKLMLEELKRRYIVVDIEEHFTTKVRIFLYYLFYNNFYFI